MLRGAADTDREGRAAGDGQRRLSEAALLTSLLLQRLHVDGAVGAGEAVLAAASAVVAAGTMATAAADAVGGSPCGDRVADGIGGADRVVQGDVQRTRRNLETTGSGGVYKKYATDSGRGILRQGM